MSWRYSNDLREPVAAAVLSGRSCSDEARKRRFWRYIRVDCPERLDFLDETGGKTNETRARGWSPQSAPLLAKVPQAH